MSLEELSDKGTPTQEEISDRLETVSKSVHQYFVSQGIDFKYNPKDSTFRNWYGRTFHVNYVAQLGYHVGNGRLHSNQININVLRGTRLVQPRLLTDEEIADILLHEKIHQDIGIIETPLAALGIGTFAVLTKSLLGTAGLLAGYFIARELLVDGIKKLKKVDKKAK